MKRFQDSILELVGVRAVIGKGGMGARTLAALAEHGAVYLSAIGGAAQYGSLHADVENASARELARHAEAVAI